MTQQASDISATKKEGVPEGLWLRCPECGDMLFRKAVDPPNKGIDARPVLMVHLRVFPALGDRVGLVDKKDDAARGLAGRAFQFLGSAEHAFVRPIGVCKQVTNVSNSHGADDARRDGASQLPATGT